MGLRREGHADCFKNLSKLEKKEVTGGISIVEKLKETDGGRSLGKGEEKW